MSSIPIALQLYSVRHDCERDLPGALEAVAEMGYDGVEFAGYYGRSARELRKMLDDLGLQVAGTHTRLPTLLDDALAENLRGCCPGGIHGRVGQSSSFRLYAEGHRDLASQVGILL